VPEKGAKSQLGQGSPGTSFDEKAKEALRTLGNVNDEDMEQQVEKFKDEYLKAQSISDA